MKTKLILIFVIFLFQFACVSKKKNSLSKENLKGKVSSVTTYTYLAKEKFGEPQKESLYEKSILNYDTKGNFIDGYEYNYKGVLDSKFTYKYNSEENMIEMNVFDSNNILTKKHIYTYDDMGNNNEMNMYEPNGELDWKYIYKYNKQGNKIEQYQYETSGRLNFKTIIKNDNDGNPIKEICFAGPKNMPLSLDSYKYKKYDKNNNWLIQESYVGDEISIILEREIEYYE